MENYFHEFNKHLLEDYKPSLYFQNLIENELFPIEYPFNMISRLIEVEQNREHHPEGSVWNHTMLVIDEAAKRRDKYENPRVLMWAALLHDIGKGPTTKVRKGKLVSYDHDKVGANMAKEFLEQFDVDGNFIQEVVSLVRWHMQILFVVKNMSFANVKAMGEDISVDKVALLGICDRLGRGNGTEEVVKREEENIKLFLKKSKEQLKI